MRISSYSYIFTGMDPEAYYTAVTCTDQQFWVVSSANREGGAQIVAKALEGIHARYPVLSKNALESGLKDAQINTSLQQIGAAASVAGAFFDGTRISPFSLGNARVYYFRSGNLLRQTEDTTEAYDKFRKSAKTPRDMDRMRLSPESNMLSKALGMGPAMTPVFSDPIAVTRDDAMVICTQSFWRYINPLEMELDFIKSAGPEEWLKTMIRRVLMKANQSLDRENFAAIAAIAEE